MFISSCNINFLLINYKKKKKFFFTQAFPAIDDHWNITANKRFQALVLDCKITVTICVESGWPINFCTIKITDPKHEKVLLNFIKPFFSLT